jgi:LEA14-like dessication related protein
MIKRHSSSVFLFLILPLLLSSCAVMESLNVSKPNVSVSDVNITGITFDGVDFAVELQVENPNSVALTLGSYSYNLGIQDAQLLSGEEQAGLSVPAGGSQLVRIPLSLNYKSALKTISGVIKGDSLNYDLGANFTFDVPVLGAVNVPVSKQGHLPMLRIPDISFSGFSVEKMNFSGAEIAVAIDVNNPNSFALQARDLSYILNINGKKWAEGVVDKSADIGAKTSDQIIIPLKLNFSEVGMSVFQMLSSGKPFEYDVQGSFTFDTDLPAFKPSKLPFNLDGTMDLNN